LLPWEGKTSKPASDRLSHGRDLLWVYDIDDVELPAFTDLGMEKLREIIRDQMDKAG
jgi:hypothetical protein